MSSDTKGKIIIGMAIAILFIALASSGFITRTYRDYKSRKKAEKSFSTPRGKRRK